ncbi:TonB-dependent receptor domain-containing protein [Providencia sp. JUb39]|uniref:TonB-dependent receptor domain-containing protein n=1 Tax=Providencia sp. JUb39 TaxID=2724165 RepID=UPI00164E1C84|nr:TonB-dependent receptor [Providencia sp. JUb39]MBC5790120.1 TonB-dependent receptor [Providencia sp. JUb39]
MAFTLRSASTSDASHSKAFSLSTLTVALAMTGFSTITLAANDVIHVTSTPLNNEKFAVAEQFEVIDTTAPEQQTASSALDLLKGQAGIFVTGAGSTYGQSVQMRGYDSRGVKIMVDNVPQDFYSGLFDATFIDPSLISKAYIHKGASSVQHGSGALAGTISIKTLTPSDILKPDQKFGGRLFGGMNRNDPSYHAGATLLGRLGPLDSVISYTQRKKQLASSPVSNKYDHHESVHNWLLKTTWYALPAYSIGLQYKEYRNDAIDLKQPEVIDTRQPKFKNSPHQRETIQKDIIIDQNFTPDNPLNWQANWSLYYTNLHLSQLDLQKKSNIFTSYSYDTETRNQYTYGSQFSNDFSIHTPRLSHHVQSGVDYVQQHQVSNEYAISYPPAEISNASAWLIDDVSLKSVPVTLSAGTRFTHYKTARENVGKQQHNNWSSRFAATVTPTSWVKLHSSYAESYRAPRLSELYNNSNHFTVPLLGLVSDFRPSPDLKPETNKTVEAGFTFSFDNFVLQGDELQIGSTYFHTKSKNHIVTSGDFKKVSGNWFPSQIFLENIPSATISGFDSHIRYSNEWFDFNINHNITDGRENDTHYSLSAIRPETLIMRFNAPIANSGVNVGWSGEFTAKTKFMGNSQYQSSNQNTENGLDRKHREVIQYAGYGVHDFYVNYKADQFVKGLNTTLTLKNAFDRDYVSSMGVPQEGRNFYWNVNYQW